MHARMPPPRCCCCFCCNAAESGLTGKAAKLRSKALTEQLKALSRSQARGGLQPYRNSTVQAGSSSSSSSSSAFKGGWQQQQQQGGGMTAEQLQEQAAMEAELEQVRLV
jgi:hypothetical protein